MHSVSWTIKGSEVLGPAPFFIAGIVNVTPDSFFDGGVHDEEQAAVAWGKKLFNDGATMVDIGGESTRPGAEPVNEAQELERVVPVVRELARHGVVSVDTFKARVAAETLAAGAKVINDVSACRFDPGLLDVVAQKQPGYVLMHALDKPREMQRDPRYDDVVADLMSFFEEHMKRLTAAGLPEDRIVLDPGIGFGKTLEHNLELMRRCLEFEKLGRPVYMGLSNKSWVQMLLDLPVTERGNATQAATAVLAARGVRIHRVHDVAATVQTLQVAQALY